MSTPIRFDQHRADRALPLRILLHDIELTANVGSFFRLADALGVEKLYLSGATPRPPNSKIKLVSRSTEGVVDFESIGDPLTLLQSLRREGFTLLALERTEHSISVDRLSLKTQSKICLLPGSEKKGLQASLLALADESIHVPMRGHNSSMNVAMASAIACYEISRHLAT